MILTAGIFIMNQKRELLLCHPTAHPSTFWSISKGKIDDGESTIEAAIRETREECNIDLRYFNLIFQTLTPVTFKNKKKTLWAFLVLAERNPDINFEAFELKCNTFVEPAKGGFPEMDNFMYVSLSKARTLVHESQVICIDEIEDILRKIDGQ